MTEHKLATLLRQAADDADARFASGKGVNELVGDISFVIENPNWNWKLVEKPDPYAKLKEAYDKGLSIETRFVGIGEWTESFRPTWNSEQEYRIKPQTVTKWLWANKDGLLTTHLLEKGDFDFTIKLEWSATEFEGTE